MKLWLKILIALFLGTLAGNFFPYQAEYLKPVGDIFLSLIHMIIVLLVFSSMTIGITSIHDPKKLGRVGLKSLFLYLVTTALAIAIGLAFAKIFQPGKGISLPSATVTVQPSQSIAEILLSVVPRNPVAALAEGNILQIIVFSLFLGVSINFAGEKGKPLLEVLESLADVMYRLTSIVMEFSPIGIFAIMAWVSASFGWDIIKKLATFLVTYYAACAAHVLIVFCPFLRFGARLKPLPFFKGMKDAIMVGFSTASSAATLPVSMHCAQENLGVSKNISSFVLPLGSTVNMNGAAIFQGMSTLFIAQAYGITLDWQSLSIVIVTSILSAVGAAGVPGSGYIMLSVVFSSIGLPLEGILLFGPIDRIRDMGSTVLNVLGDSLVAVYIAKQEGELDERQYLHEELVELEGSDI